MRRTVHELICDSCGATALLPESNSSLYPWHTLPGSDYETHLCPNCAFKPEYVTQGLNNLRALVDLEFIPMTISQDDLLWLLSLYDRTVEEHTDEDDEFDDLAEDE